MATDAADARLRAAGVGVVRRELDPRLLATDRLLQRWAVSIGSGLPSDKWDERTLARPPPLDDETAILVDRCVMKAPRKIRLLTIAWYKTPQPERVIAQRLRLSRNDVRLEWFAAVGYFRATFSSIGLDVD